MATEEELPLSDPTFQVEKYLEFQSFINGDAEDFDMNRCDPGSWIELSARIPTLRVTSCGGFAPLEAEGTIHGYPFYFRYEYGSADLSVHPKGPLQYLPEYALWTASIRWDEEGTITLSATSFMDAMLTLVPKLERSPYLWSFVGWELKYEEVDGAITASPTDEVQVYRGWGKTAEEGYAYLQNPSSYLISKGWTAEFQAECLWMQNIQPEPLYPDPREYPDVHPEWLVLP